MIMVMIMVVIISMNDDNYSDIDNIDAISSS